MDDALRLKQLLLATNATISVAESITGGRLQAAITSVSGSSEYFAGGITAYNIEQKVRHLGVGREHAASVNCVSERVAGEMASGVRRLFGTTIGVATTGYAEPNLANGVTEPFAYFAVEIAGRGTQGRIDATGLSRVAAQEHVARETLAAVVALLSS